jgi:micrococcal nuclease
VLFTLFVAALTVIAVHDGDTLVVSELGKRETIRLAEVDAPERTQPYSQVSRRNLILLCQHAKAIELKRVETDRFGRTVAHVFCDGIHANWRQVEDGLAWCFTRYLRNPAECLPRQEAARAAGSGLWRDADPTAPWVFRENQRRAARN